jgi:hypothetical protein
VVSLSMLPQDSPSSPKQDAGAPEPNALPKEAVDNIEMPLPSAKRPPDLGIDLGNVILRQMRQRRRETREWPAHAFTPRAR